MSKISKRLRDGGVKVLLTSDIGNVQSFVNGIITNFIPTLITVVIFGPVICFEMGWAGFLSIITAFFLVPLSILFSKWIKDFQRAIQTINSDFLHITEEWLKQIRFIRSNSLGKHFATVIEDTLKTLLIAISKRHVLIVINFSISMLWW